MTRPLLQVDRKTRAIEAVSLECLCLLPTSPSTARRHYAVAALASLASSVQQRQQARHDIPLGYELL